MRIRNYRNCHTHAYAINARGAALMLQKAQPPPAPPQKQNKNKNKKKSAVCDGGWQRVSSKVSSGFFVFWWCDFP
jgi:hypothetical protein